MGLEAGGGGGGGGSVGGGTSVGGATVGGSGVLVGGGGGVLVGVGDGVSVGVWVNVAVGVLVGTAVSVGVIVGVGLGTGVFVGGASVAVAALIACVANNLTLAVGASVGASLRCKEGRPLLAMATKRPMAPVIPTTANERKTRFLMMLTPIYPRKSAKSALSAFYPDALRQIAR
ncbi:MAG: hypothetical protein GY803_15365 [Chloroflexi bacterium]|nr:hypothetical protein [Chloroflexota bacterium]